MLQKNLTKSTTDVIRPNYTRNRAHVVTSEALVLHISIGAWVSLNLSLEEA